MKYNYNIRIWNLKMSLEQKLSLLVSSDGKSVKDHLKELFTYEPSENQEN